MWESCGISGEREMAKIRNARDREEKCVSEKIGALTGIN